MASFTYELVALRRLRNEMRTLAAEMPDIADEVLNEWGQETRGELKRTPYPARPAGSRYVRTGQLANRWAVRRLGRGKIAIVNNAARRGRTYPTYVIGTAETGDQAYMHEGRWWKAKAVIDGRMARLRSLADMRLMQELKARGL